jgi:hypothetical protein
LSFTITTRTDGRPPIKVPETFAHLDDATAAAKALGLALADAGNWEVVVHVTIADDQGREWRSWEARINRRGRPFLRQVTHGSRAA